MESRSVFALRASACALRASADRSPDTLRPCDHAWLRRTNCATDNQRRARTIGIDVRRHQLVAFVISGFFSGLAGGLFAFYNGSVFPDFAFFTKSFGPLVVTRAGTLLAAAVA
jgi:hypothetical protein